MSRKHIEISMEKKKKVLEIKPEHFGCKNRKLSEEIDEILYGEGND